MLSSALSIPSFATADVTILSFFLVTYFDLLFGFPLVRNFSVQHKWPLTSVLRLLIQGSCQTRWFVTFCSSCFYDVTILGNYYSSFLFFSVAFSIASFLQRQLVSTQGANTFFARTWSLMPSHCACALGERITTGLVRVSFFLPSYFWLFMRSKKKRV